VKRLQFVLGLLLLAALVFSGCAAPATTEPQQATSPAATEQAAAATQPPAAGEPVTLKVWYWGEQEAPGMQKFMEKAAQIFNEENDKIKVEVTLQETDSIYPAFRAAAEAGEGPDIQTFFGGIFTLEDAWLGNLAPISDYWTEEELSHVPLGQRAETFWDGKQWGLPFYQIGTFWAYNKVMFADAGLDPENPPATWDEWLGACRALRAAGYTPIGTGFKDGWLGGWMVSYLGQQNFDSAEDLMKAIKGEASLTDPKYAEWWSRWKEMQDNNCFNDDVMSLDLYQGQSLFEQEQAAMTNHVEPYMVVLERSMGADKVGVMRTPVFGTGKLANSVGIPTQTMNIASFSKHKAEAADFLRFLHREDIMKMMYEMAGAVTPDDRFQTEWLDTNIDKQILQWRSEFPLFWYQYYYPPVWESEGAIALGQLLMAGDITPEEAAQRWEDVANKNREQNPEQLKNYEKWVLPPELTNQ
jgi:raffinose/stachyose/melibiose transport system substrate-binding protein